MREIEVPYLVIGAGPVGMLAALLLARQGRRTLLVERRSEPRRAPAAHVVNARTFEICRQAGVDMDAIARACKKPEDAGQSLFVTRLAGEEIGRLPFEQQGDDVLAHTPTPLRNLSQHRFEPILLDALSKRPEAEVCFGWQWEGAEQDAEGVTSLVRDLGRDEPVRVRSRYVIAADGAGSRVRKSLGIEMEGPPKLQSFLMVHFAANLRPLVGHHPGVLYWVLDPEAAGTFVAHDIDREWVFMHSFDSDAESLDDYDEARCRALVQAAMGTDAHPIEILGRSDWTMSAQVASAMRSGRIFLAGDAAHRFPPTGGLGLNTGAQDVHGLVWKLCAVEDGQAPESLLDSYEQERRPVARNNADQSLRNALKLVQLPQALGTDREPTTARLQATLADARGRRGVEDAIAAQAEHFDMLGLQIGYAYQAGALVPDGSAPPALANPVREFAPSSRPGARLPHAWLLRDGERVSSLDLVSDAGLTLLSWGGDEAWAKAVGAVQGVPIHHVRIGSDATEQGDHWARVCGLERGGALLVRPDQHVAWRAVTAPPDAAAALGAAVAGTLGRGGLAV